MAAASAARTFPCADDVARAAALGPMLEQARLLDEQLERLTRRRDAPVAVTPFHPTNRGQSVGDRMRMRTIGAQLSGEYNMLAMTALETDPDLALSLLSRALTAAPKGDLSVVKTLCNLGVCCLHTGRTNAALRHLRHAIDLEAPHLPPQQGSSSSSSGSGSSSQPSGGAAATSTAGAPSGLDVLFRARIRLNLCAALNHTGDYQAALFYAEAAVGLLSPQPPLKPRGGIKGGRPVRLAMQPTRAAVAPATSSDDAPATSITVEDGDGDGDDDVAGDVAGGDTAARGDIMGAPGGAATVGASATGAPDAVDASSGDGASEIKGVEGKDLDVLRAIALHNCCACHEFLGQFSHALVAARRALKVATSALSPSDELLTRLSAVAQSVALKDQQSLERAGKPTALPPAMRGPTSLAEPSPRTKPSVRTKPPVPERRGRRTRTDEDLMSALTRPTAAGKAAQRELKEQRDERARAAARMAGLRSRVGIADPADAAENPALGRLTQVTEAGRVRVELTRQETARRKAWKLAPSPNAKRNRGRACATPPRFRAFSKVCALVPDTSPLPCSVLAFRPRLTFHVLLHGSTIFVAGLSRRSRSQSRGSRSRGGRSLSRLPAESKDIYPQDARLLQQVPDAAAGPGRTLNPEVHTAPQSAQAGCCAQAERASCWAHEAAGGARTRIDEIIFEGDAATSHPPLPMLSLSRVHISTLLRPSMTSAIVRPLVTISLHFSVLL